MKYDKVVREREAQPEEEAEADGVQNAKMWGKQWINQVESFETVAVHRLRSGIEPQVPQ